MDESMTMDDRRFEVLYWDFAENHPNGQKIIEDSKILASRTGVAAPFGLFVQRVVWFVVREEGQPDIQQFEIGYTATPGTTVLRNIHRVADEVFLNTARETVEYFIGGNKEGWRPMNGSSNTHRTDIPVSSLPILFD